MNHFHMPWLLAAAIAVGLAGPGLSEPVSDALFRPGAFSADTPGEVTVYSHTRQGPEAEAFDRVEDGQLVVTPELREETVILDLHRIDDGQELPLSDFAADGGNPVLLFFLESTVRNMAMLTGGSPFYIRNRIREALAEAEGTPGTRTLGGESFDVTEVTLQPFAEDPNRGRMGPFAGLTLQLALSQDHPAHLLELSADTAETGGDYRETLVLDPEAS